VSARSRRVVLGLALVLAAGLVVAVGFAVEVKRRRERARIVARALGTVYELLPSPDGLSILALAPGARRGSRVFLFDLDSTANVRDVDQELGESFWIVHEPRTLVLVKGHQGLGAPHVGGIEAHDLRAFAKRFGESQVRCFSEDGRLVVVARPSHANFEGAFELWEVDAGTLRRSIPLVGTKVAEFSHDGRRVLVGTWIADVVVHDTVTGDQLARFRTTDDIVDVHFIDAERIACVERHGLELLAAAGPTESSFDWNRPAAVACDFSRGGRFVATVDDALGVEVRDLRSRALVFERNLRDAFAELREPGEELRCVAFAPEADSVFVGTGKGLIIRVPVRLPEAP
jgi:hypothetical protein